MKHSRVTMNQLLILRQFFIYIYLKATYKPLLESGIFVIGLLTPNPIIIALIWPDECQSVSLTCVHWADSECLLL